MNKPDAPIGLWKAGNTLLHAWHSDEQHAGDGRSSAEIGSELHLSEVIAKLGAANRTDAARIGRTRSWL